MKSIKELTKVYEEAIEKFGSDSDEVKEAFKNLTLAIKDASEDEKPEGTKKDEETDEETEKRILEKLEAKFKAKYGFKEVSKKTNGKVLSKFKSKIPEQRLKFMSYSDFDNADYDSLPENVKHGLYFQEIFAQKLHGVSKNPHFITEVVKTQTEGTDSEGGYLVPEQTLDDILSVRTSHGKIRANARIVPMTGKTLKMNSIGQVVVYNKAEEAEFTESDAVFDQQELTIAKITGLTSVTNELLADSPVSVTNLLNTEFRRAIAKREDQMGFLGDGSASYGGVTGILESANSDITTVTMSSGNVNFSDISGDDVISMIFGVTDDYRDGAKFYCNEYVLELLHKLKDSTGRYLYAEFSNPLTGEIQRTLKGYPIVLVSTMPGATDSAVSTKFLIFGSLNIGQGFIWGMRQGIRFDFSPHATLPTAGNMFTTDKVALRVVSRGTGGVRDGNALAILKTAAS